MAMELQQLKQQTATLQQQLSQKQSEDKQPEIGQVSDKLSNELQQAREVIRELRLQNQSIEQEFSEKLSELEAQATEYRLKFNFAQQQLQSNRESVD